MPAILNTLLGLNILHTIVKVLEEGLIICLLVQFVISWIPRAQESKFGRVIINITAPLVNPLNRLIPPISIGGLSLSIGFILAWWGILAVAALLGQALPAGW